MAIIADRVDLSGLGSPEAQAVIARVIHATADIAYARELIANESAVQAGIRALSAAAPIICDVEMVRSGVVVHTGSGVHCYLDETALNAGPWPTRSAAAIAIAAERHQSGAIFIIGCAPSALITLVELIEAGRVTPALVIGLPVGFVGATESKARLMKMAGVPFITNSGEKGGSSAAAAAVNALARLAAHQIHPAAGQANQDAGEARPAAGQTRWRSGKTHHDDGRTEGQPARRSQRQTQDPAGLLLIGHGTRSEEGVQQARSLTTLVERLLPGHPVRLGFIELANPTLDEAVEELAMTGVDRIAAVPLVLLPAGHMKDDGPSLLARARLRYPRVSFSYGRDYGAHPLVLQVAEDAIRSTVASLTGSIGCGEPGGAREAAGVVIVGRGSTDPDSNAELHKVARLLADSRNLGAVAVTSDISARASRTESGARVPVSGAGLLSLVEPAFVSLAPPSVEDALERTRRLGARRIAVVPYFLFHGLLVDRIESEAREWAANHPGVEVVTGQAFGPDHRLADLAVERFEEALGGRALMNCDCCTYRVDLPGYVKRTQAV